MYKLGVVHVITKGEGKNIRRKEALPRCNPSPFDEVIYKEDIKEFDRLVEQGEHDVKEATDAECSPSILSAAGGHKNIYIMKRMIELGCDVNRCGEEMCYIGKSAGALSCAVYNKNPAFTRLLIEKGADLTFVDSSSELKQKCQSVLDEAKKAASKGCSHNLELVEAALKGLPLPPLFPEEMDSKGEGVSIKGEGTSIKEEGVSVAKPRSCCSLFNWC